MFKMIVFLVQIAITVLTLYILLPKRSPLDEIPGPKPYPFIGNVLQMDMTKVFVQFANFAKQYGGIFKVKLFTKPVVIVNNPRFIHDVLVKQSAEFAGHPYSYRNKLYTQDFSEITFTDPEHRGRRKACRSTPSSMDQALTELKILLKQQPMNS